MDHLEGRFKVCNDRVSADLYCSLNLLHKNGHKSAAGIGLDEKAFTPSPLYYLEVFKGYNADVSSNSGFQSRSSM